MWKRVKIIVMSKIEDVDIITLLDTLPDVFWR
jgi:hypothetical protein